LHQWHEVVSTDVDELDITDPAAVDAMINRVRPDVIINCAAYTDVDGCETEKDHAWKVNVEGPKNLALGLETHGGQLIHISTDYVFDGNKPPPEPYVEEDEPHPVSSYGKTKLEGELAVREIAERHVILRTAWLYGMKGSNFLKTMLRSASRDPEKEIRVVNDQFGSPTWSYRLALQIARLMEVESQGTYHATSEGHCSWYDLATFFLEMMGIPHRVAPCTTEAYPTPAVRPSNSVLENRRLKEEGVHVMVNWKEDIEQFVSMFGESLIEETKRA
jgi:dTDP-4-dehydrorhamnose reductase